MVTNPAAPAVQLHQTERVGWARTPGSPTSEVAPILAPVVDRVRCVTVKLGTLQSETLGGLKHSPAAFAGGGGIGNSHGWRSVKVDES